MNLSSAVWGLVGGTVVSLLLSFAFRRISWGGWATVVGSVLIGCLVVGFFTAVPSDGSAVAMWLWNLVNGGPATIFIGAWLIAALATTFVARRRHVRSD